MTGIGKESAMYQTIHRQPADIRHVLDDWSDASAAAAAIASAARLHIVGIGTSYHAALMGQWGFRSIGVNARAISSYDFANYPAAFPLSSDDVVLVLSHSGAKQYSLAAMEIGAAAGATVLSVGGTAAEHPGSTLILRTTERERSAAFTSSHTTAMAVLAQVVVAVAEGRGVDGVAQLRRAVEALPENIESMLAHEDDLEALARACVDRQTYVVGGGPSEVAALEAVIKGREAAYVRIDGMALEQFIHGPMICLQEDDPVVLIHVDGGATARSREAYDLFTRLGASVAVFGSGFDSVEPEFAVPATEEWLSIILTTVPTQLLAWHMATLQKLDPDTFRTQVPRFKDAIGRISL